jgi:hypothetical protein
MARLPRLIFIQHLAVVHAAKGSGSLFCFAASGIFVIPHQLDYHHLNALLLSHSSRLQHHIFIGHRMIFTKNLSSANS